MDIVTDVKQKNKRYLPHELTTKINSVKLYRQTKDIDFVLRRYHISKSSLMRWNKQYWHCAMCYTVLQSLMLFLGGTADELPPYLPPK